MGLDMYLYLKKEETIGRWDEGFEEKKAGFYPDELREFEEKIAEHNFLSKSTVCQIGYWRKANAIHSWFVENCADGKDDCSEVYVSVDAAKKLLSVCKEVLEDHSKAPELLPTRAGFFFGGTEYSEWYFRDLEYTVDLLERVIGFMESRDPSSGIYWSVIYQASW